MIKTKTGGEWQHLRYFSILRSPVMANEASAHPDSFSKEFGMPFLVVISTD
jgi:hypothetical protein